MHTQLSSLVCEMSSRGKFLIAIVVFTRFICISSVNVPATVKPVRTRAASTLKKSHPCLYFSRSDIIRLRKQLHASHASLYERLFQIVEDIKDPTTKAGKVPPVAWQEFVVKWNEVYGNKLAVLAMYSALTPGDSVARKLAKLYMRRLAGYPSWLVKGREMDAVPAAHSLLGFATAFDLLYDTFTHSRRARYLKKLHQTGTMFYKMSLRQSDWGNFYIHNHVATNYVALLASAIVIKPHYPKEAATWTTRSISALNTTMNYLKMVVDGSLNEGVSYGTYTMRSLVQFFFLTKRHMNYTYTNNNWLSEHFYFLLHSVLPGFQRTFGIADSVLDWAYSPESVLLFLESNVVHDGSALWLANRIKKHRSTKRRMQMLSNTHNTIVLEFLFYNKTINEAPPHHSNLHLFSDLGVITYGGGTPAGKVYLSFKCGRLHGRGINTLRPQLKKNIQKGFRPGHEQPDQGSFVFIAKEQAVVTESFYAPKFTFLENSLMFGPSQKCSGPCVGQFGEGSLWLNSFDNRTWLARGELVGYSTHGNIVFMSGDMTGWYDQSLGLDTVYRAVVMLSSSVLVVIDTIRLRTSSHTTHVSTFFHNVDIPFKISNDTVPGSLPCSLIGLYSVCWAHHGSRTLNMETIKSYRMKRARYPTNFINITWQLLTSLSSTAYVFHGPDDVLHDVNVSQTLQAHGIQVNLQINTTEYTIVLSSQHNNLRSRRTLLGSNGYGKLHINQSVINLGVNGKKVDVNLLHRDNYFRIKVDQSAFLYAPAASTLVLLGLFAESVRRARLFRFIRWAMFALFVVSFLTLLVHYQVNPKLFQLTSSSTSTRLHKRRAERRHLDAVIITGLPLHGGKIARELFTMNTDFLVIDVPSEDIVPPLDCKIFDQKLDLSEWKSDRKMTSTNIAMDVEKRTLEKWWKTVIRAPALVKKNGIKETVAISDPLNPEKRYWVDVSKSRGALGMVYLQNPGWLFKIKWLNSKVFKNNHTPTLYVVRDPRSWIEHLLSQVSVSDLFLRDLENALLEDLLGIELPTEVSYFQEVYNTGMPAHIMLAHVWQAFVSYALELTNSLPSGRFRIVRFERLVSFPRKTGQGVFDFLEMPFSAAMEHRILLVTKSGVLNLDDYGIINKKLTSWGEILSNEKVLQIEQICRKTMTKLGYS